MQFVIATISLLLYYAWMFLVMFGAFVLAAYIIGFVMGFIAHARLLGLRNKVELAHRHSKEFVRDVFGMRPVYRTVN